MRAIRASLAAGDRQARGTVRADAAVRAWVVREERRDEGRWVRRAKDGWRGRRGCARRMRVRAGGTTAVRALYVRRVRAACPQSYVFILPGRIPGWFFSETEQSSGAVMERALTMAALPYFSRRASTADSRFSRR